MARVQEDLISVPSTGLQAEAHTEKEPVAVGRPVGSCTQIHGPRWAPLVSN